MEELQTRFCEFTVPSGYKYTIREQNGADDDILSNPSEAKDLTNISRFISSIVTQTDYTSTGKLTLRDAQTMPSLDRYCILIQSRIFSMGQDLEFTYDWGSQNGGEVSYVQDLNEFLFDYSTVPSEEELVSKPDAIPFYPLGQKVKDIEFTTSSGKIIKFDILNSLSEAYILNLPLEKRTKNQELISRNLHTSIEGKWEKVTSFRFFSMKDMAEIRKYVATVDPLFTGTTKIQNPNYPDLEETISIMAVKGFFYPGEM